MNRLVISKGKGDARRVRRGWTSFLRLDRLVGFLVLLLLLVFQATNPPPVEALRLQLFDFYQQVRPREAKPQPVRIVDLDEESLASVGQWPWPRTIVADLVSKLFQQGAVVVGFDVVFAEPDRLSPSLVAESLRGADADMIARLKTLPSNDAALAAAIAAGRVVLGQSTLEQEVAGADGQATARTPIAEIGGDPRPYIFHFPGVLRNIPVLETAAAGRGMFSLTPEADGVIRRVPAIVAVGADTSTSTIYPGLGLEILRVGIGQSAMAVRSRPYGYIGRVGIDHIVLGQRIPTDTNGRIWVRFAAHDRARYVSAKDVLSGAVPAERIAGHLVLIGTSATGLRDIRQTPVNSAMPGVEVHAQLLENILGGELLTRPAEAPEWEILATLGVGLVLILILPMVGPWWTVGIAGLAGIGLAGGSWYAFAARSTLLDMSFPLIANFVVYSVMSFTNYLHGELERRRVRGAFSRYLSPALVNRLAEEPGQLHLGGETRNVSVMFCDVQNFTTISERYTAEQLTHLINRFFTPMTAAILARSGTVDKFLGDCVMAFWNAPLDDPRHAENACRAALLMRASLGPLNRDMEAEAAAENRPHHPINAGIGINTGECCVGNLGAEQRFDYSVIGDSVNLASRLQGLTKVYGVGIVIGENTSNEAKALAQVELDLVRVVGKTKPARIFALLGDEKAAATDDFNALSRLQADFLARYRAQDWASARRAAEAAAAFAGAFGLDKLYKFYANRIALLEREPPGADWDGVFSAESK